MIGQLHTVTGLKRLSTTFLIMLVVLALTILWAFTAIMMLVALIFGWWEPSVEAMEALSYFMLLIYIFIIILSIVGTILWIMGILSMRKGKDELGDLHYENVSSGIRRIGIAVLIFLLIIVVGFVEAAALDKFSFLEFEEALKTARNYEFFASLLGAVMGYLAFTGHSLLVEHLVPRTTRIKLRLAFYIYLASLLIKNGILLYFLSSSRSIGNIETATTASSIASIAAIIAWMIVWRAYSRARDDVGDGILWFQEEEYVDEFAPGDGEEPYTVDVECPECRDVFDMDTPGPGSYDVDCPLCGAFIEIDVPDAW